MTLAKQRRVEVRGWLAPNHTRVTLVQREHGNGTCHLLF